jgi:type II protein arginine methyltransferase
MPMDRSSLPDTILARLKEIEGQPDHAVQLARLSGRLRAMNRHADAEQMALEALAQAPDDALVRSLTHWARAKRVPAWHFPMMNIAARNRAYARGIERAVAPGATVVEIGTGSGLLAMMAARAGAAHVYTLEEIPEIAEVARRIVELNGFAGQITVIPKHSARARRGVDFPDSVDVLIMEPNSHAGIVEALRQARDLILSEHTAIVPQALAVRGRLVGGERLRVGARVTTAEGFDLAPFNVFAPARLTWRGTGYDLDDYSAAFEMARLDMSAEPVAETICDRIDLPITASGLTDGILHWHVFDFGDGIVFEDDPHDQPYSHWSRTVQVFPASIEVEAGGTLGLECESVLLDTRIWPISLP